MIEYDEEAFTDAVKGLKCMDTALMKEPVNAGISDYVPGRATILYLKLREHM